jgi:membrane protein implicated in regulation of membrane protease activity
VPRWLPIAAAVLVVAQFAVPGDRVLDVIQAALMTCYVALAWWVQGGAR